MTAFRRQGARRRRPAWPGDRRRPYRTEHQPAHAGRGSTSAGPGTPSGRAWRAAATAGRVTGHSLPHLRRRTLTSPQAAAAPGILTWLHIGDLHLTGPRAANRRDLRAHRRPRGRPAAGQPRFRRCCPATTPMTARPSSTAWCATRLARFALPLHILPGDHDLHPGTWTPSTRCSARERCRTRRRSRGHPLPVPRRRLGRHRRPRFPARARSSSPGPSGSWSRPPPPADVAIFMHTYPADLREGGDRLGALLASPTSPASTWATRTTTSWPMTAAPSSWPPARPGRSRKGPPASPSPPSTAGASSWRFKPLDTAWPFVLVTRPADSRLATAPAETAAGRWSGRRCWATRRSTPWQLHVDDGAWRPMQPFPSTACGRPCSDGRPTPCRAGPRRSRAGRTRTGSNPHRPATPPDPPADGSDRDRIGAWPEKGIVGGQLGPNRNGRKW